MKAILFLGVSSVVFAGVARAQGPVAEPPPGGLGAPPPLAADDERLAPATEFVPPGADLSMSAPESWTGPSDTAPAIPLKWGGKVQTENHYRVKELHSGSWYDHQELPAHFARNENKLNLRLTAGSDRFGAVADVDFDWLGIVESPVTLGSLTRYQDEAPYRLQAHALYLEANDIGIPGLDLRVGQQIIGWGVGDQFNPTNNLNANDLENVLFFGRQVANNMVRLDYSVFESFTLSGVLVPVFKPAILPESAPLGVTAVDRTPFVEEALRYRVAAERAFGEEAGYPTMVKSAEAVLPKTTWQNMQYELRAAGTILGHDVALSYYNGRTDIPVAVTNHVSQQVGQICNPANPAQCADGLLLNDVTVKYPRTQVVGLNMTGEVNPLGFISKSVKPLGYRIEVGVYFPEATHFSVLQDPITLFGLSRPAGEYPYNLPGGGRPLAVPSTPFAKWVVGLDYSFSRHIYANAMWVHGLPDEFGAGDFINEGWSVRQATVGKGAPIEECVLNGLTGDQKAGDPCAIEKLRHRLGDYAVVGVDYNFDEGRGLVRLFTVWDLGGIYVTQWDDATQGRTSTHYGFWTNDGFSAVIFPELDYNFGGGLTLALGALLQLGKPYTKFGDAAAGGSLVWTRATYAY